MMKTTTVELSINTEWCKGCGICVAFCPKQVLELNRQEKSEVAHLDDCIACRMCMLRCPDLAIEVFTNRRETENRHDNPEC